MTTSVIKVVVCLKKKKKLKLQCFYAFLIVPGWSEDYVESVASSHFCLFGAGSAEGSVDEQNLFNWTVYDFIVNQIGK